MSAQVVITKFGKPQLLLNPKKEPAWNFDEAADGEPWFHTVPRLGTEHFIRLAARAEQQGYVVTGLDVANIDELDEGIVKAATDLIIHLFREGVVVHGAVQGITMELPLPLRGITLSPAEDAGIETHLPVHIGPLGEYGSLDDHVFTKVFAPVWTAMHPVDENPAPARRSWWRR